MTRAKMIFSVQAQTISNVLSMYVCMYVCVFLLIHCVVFLLVYSFLKLAKEAAIIGIAKFPFGREHFQV
jgi:type IV secretory pathway VirB3-like protein